MQSDTKSHGNYMNKYIVYWLHGSVLVTCTISSISENGDLDSENYKQCGNLKVGSISVKSIHVHFVKSIHVHVVSKLVTMMGIIKESIPSQEELVVM